MKTVAQLKNDMDRARAKESRARAELAHISKKSPKNVTMITERAARLRQAQIELAKADEALAEHLCSPLQVGNMFRGQDGALYQISRFYIRKIIHGEYLGGWMSKRINTEDRMQAHFNEAREFTMDEIENLPRGASQESHSYIFNWWDIA